MGFDPVSYLLGKQAGGGGGGVTVEALSVTENGVYTAPAGKAYSPVTVAVPLNVGLKGGASSNFLFSRYKNVVFSPPINKLLLNATYSSGLNAGSFSSGLQGVAAIELIVDTGIIGMNYAFNNCKVPHITIRAETSSCTNFSDAFAGNDNETFFITVDGDALDLSSATSLDNMLGKRVKEIRFVADSAKISWTMNNCESISDNTLVSIANALDGTVTGKTLTIHATPKAKCQTLMGTVADGLFTADASGTVTLADFITNTKGWTLA